MNSIVPFSTANGELAVSSLFPWLCLLAPLFATLLITFCFFTNKKLSALLSIAACGVSFALALGIFFTSDTLEHTNSPFFNWIHLPNFQIHISMLADRLAKLMLLVVTGIGFLIHLFSYGYMKEDPGMSRFFAKLSFFMFSMMGIVLASNLVMMFIFWELVGLSSYLLIGFWYQRPSAAEAAKKAFLVNRIGDFGFMIGILCVWQLFGTLHFEELSQSGFLAEKLQGVWHSSLIDIMAFGLFCGCMGKSAQLPLHVWLPDAMEGPTPVSALIHAATMVAAGIYMLCRVFALISLSSTIMLFIAFTGAFTALFAAMVAIQQNDIKRILAYSTLSQLGYMVMSVGLGAPTASMFHLTTHAFFEALLFLGAGSVIYALHHEQHIWNMGGLLKKMPITAWTFIVGAAALMGVPFLSGFFSKEEILTVAFLQNRFCFWIAVCTAVLTAFYMTRLLIVVFLSKARTKEAEHAHESSSIMTGPLILLAFLSIGGGYLHIRSYLGSSQLINDAAHSFVMGASILALILGTLSAWILYFSTKKEPIHLRLLANKFYIDELYESTFVFLQNRLALSLAWFDRWILEGVLVRGSSVAAIIGGEVLRLVQGGNVKLYIIAFVLGVLFLLDRLFSML